MLRIEILTLFPNIFKSFLEESIIKRSIEKSLINVDIFNFRKNGLGKNFKVDGRPYGGGAGMLLRVEPIAKTLKEREKDHEFAGRSTHSILITPQGRPFTQEIARELSRMESVLVFICGRYEGFDERVRKLVTEEISGGDYICLGGEVIAMAMMEAIGRLVPNIISNKNSTDEESFSESLLEYPQYTRPDNYEGMKVPLDLISGDHKRIKEWRKKQALLRTKKRRPDLI